MAVDDVSLTVAEGEFLTLLGPSGCGKTTMLRMIAGLEDPSEGEIVMHGQLVWSTRRGVFIPPGKRNLGLVFQSYALWPHMTAAENVGFGLRIKGLPKEEIRRRVQEALDQLQLSELGQRYPQELSGGQQQRVALARMLVTRPRIFLMDEPLSNLDAKLRVDMRAEIKRLHREAGATTIYVTHDQAEALTMSDRIVVMREGVVQQVGTPREVYRRPANLFVAGFMGNPAANLLSGRTAVVDGRIVVEVGAFCLPTTAPPEMAGRSVVASIRPEEVQLSLSPEEGAVPFTIYSALPGGADLIVKARKEGIEVTCRMMADLILEPDTTVYLRFPPRAVNLYDQQSGRLIYSGDQE